LPRARQQHSDGDHDSRGSKRDDEPKVAFALGWHGWDEPSRKWGERSRRWNEPSRKWDKGSRKWDEPSRKIDRGREQLRLDGGQRRDGLGDDVLPPGRLLETAHEVVELRVDLLAPLARLLDRQPEDFQLRKRRGFIEWDSLAWHQHS
jgi:hypothetical protein